MAATSAAASALGGVARKIFVLSGKGGVGKSTLSSQLAFGLAARGKRVGLLDLDLCGPSIPLLLGRRGRQKVGQAADGQMAPLVVQAAGPAGEQLELSVMSIGFLLDKESDALVLRGPRKDAVVRQFLTGVSWGELDFLLVDTPPGTSDEHISITTTLKDQMAPRDGALVVSTPQALSLADVAKELTFCATSELPVLGLVENMAPMRTPLVGGAVRFFDADGRDVSAQTTALLEERPELRGVSVGIDLFPKAGGGTAELAASVGVPFLGSVPLDERITSASAEGSPCTTAALGALVDALLEEPRVLSDEEELKLWELGGTRDKAEKP